MKLSLIRRKVWVFDYLIPILSWRWCVIEIQQEMLCMGGDIAWFDKEVVIFKSNSKEKCLTLMSEIQ